MRTATSRAVLFVLSSLCAFPSWSARAASPPVITTDDDHVLVDGAPLFLKGVDYSPFIAGDAPWTGPVKIDFRKDMREIKEVLNASAVRVYDALPLPKAFYDAAREFDVWILQGIYLPNAPDLLATLPQAKEAIAMALDHVYKHQGQDRVLAYVLGSSFSVESVAGTIRAHQGLPRFQGTHYRVPAAPRLPAVDLYVGCPEPGFTAFEDPHPFQSYLAELADHLAELEEAPGRSRHLVGHASSPEFSPFLGTRDRATPHPVDVGFLDVVFENAFTYNVPYIIHHGLGEYLERLKRFYPRTPVVLLETGYSTSPSGRIAPPGPLCGFPYQDPRPLTLAFGGTSEAEQAQALEARWLDVVSSPVPLAGFFVYSYYDEWWLDGKPDQQAPDQPLEWFGLKRVRGTPAEFTVTPKPAFDKLAELFGCEEPSALATRCAPVIRTPRVLAASYGKPVSVPLQAAGGILPYTWSISEGSLPPGVSIDSAGARITGAPERMGVFRFRLRVEERNGSRERLGCMRVGPPDFTIDRDRREILLNGEPFFLKGIDYSPFICGDAPWTPMVMADPFVHLKRIKEELHANAIRIYQTAPRTVYDAARRNGLFVIQGIHLQVDGPFAGECEHDDPQKPHPVDLLDPAFFASMEKHVLSEIDEVYKAGGGDTVLCHVVGNEINFCSQKRTIIENQDHPRYESRYYTVPPAPPALPALDQYPGCPPEVEKFWDPHPFQSFIAELVDLAIDRELELTGARHLMAHATEPNMSLVPSRKDRFDARDHFPVDMGFLDIVFQNVYSYFPPFIRYFGYRNYLDLCRTAYPRTPFVVLECGYNTLPGQGPDTCATGPECGQPAVPREKSYCFFGGNTEEEQAVGLAERWREVALDPPAAAGFFVFEYFDEWWKGHQLSQFVQDNEPEEWFGLLRVRGTREDCQVSDKPAFETVRRMFSSDEDPGWCPGQDGLSCAVEAGGSVQVEVDPVEPYDAIVLERDGAALATLPSGVRSYRDPAPPPGLRTYRAVARKAWVDCPAIECRVEVGAAGKTFRRGDADANKVIELTDPVRLLGFLFLGQGPPECPDAADFDDDGKSDISDAIASLGYQFLGGPPPPDPGPMVCGLDPTAEVPELGCDASCP